jgi:hypothetical protein
MAELLMAGASGTDELPRRLSSNPSSNPKAAITPTAAEIAPTKSPRAGRPPWVRTVYLNTAIPTMHPMMRIPNASGVI